MVAPVTGRACDRCGAAHHRYAPLCAGCDPTFLAPVLRCVAPLRCYCARHKGRGRTITGATVAHTYGYGPAFDLANPHDARVTR